MAGAGCAAGSAPDIRHQPPGKAQYIFCNYCESYNCSCSMVFRQLAGMHMVVASNTDICNFLLFLFFVHSNMTLYMPFMNIVYTWSEHVCTLTCIQIVCSCIYKV
jgi:hypothetical protein